MYVLYPLTLLPKPIPYMNSTYISIYLFSFAYNALLNVILNVAGIQLSPRPKSVWRTLISSLSKTIMMNVESYIVFQEWTVRKLPRSCRFIF